MDVCTAPVQTTAGEFYSFEITSHPPVLSPCKPQNRATATEERGWGGEYLKHILRINADVYILSWLGPRGSLSDEDGGQDWIVGCVWFQVGRNGRAGCGFEIQETSL